MLIAYVSINASHNFICAAHCWAYVQTKAQPAKAGVAKPKGLNGNFSAWQPVAKHISSCFYGYHKTRRRIIF